MLKAALHYAQKLGFAVFPLHWIENNKCSCGGKKSCSPGKHPLTYKGVKDATKDQQQIIEWWTKWKNANIGIACGSISGIFVLDVDLKETANGYDSIAELENKYGSLPETPMQLSGSGGTHYFFKHDNRLKNGINFLPGLDIRTDGGYIIGAPSNHISGKEYAWEVSNHVLETSIATAPEWLIQKVLKNSGGKSNKKPTSHFTSILKGVGKGSRNHSAASLTGHLLRKNIEPELVFELLMIWNETRCKPPMSEDEVTKTFISILTKEINRKKGV